ncbi:unnamed protein product [Mortierella alpina]
MFGSTCDFQGIKERRSPPQIQSSSSSTTSSARQAFQRNSQASTTLPINSNHKYKHPTMKFTLAIAAIVATIASTQAATGTVRTAGDPLNIHSAPSTSSAVVGSIKNGASVDIDCTATGTTVTGKFGTSSVWDHVPGGYVTDTYVYTGTDGPAAPACGGTTPPAPGGCQAPGISNPRTCAGAVQWAVNNLSTARNPEYIGMCDKIMARAYGRSYSGFTSAWVHWQSTPAKYKHVGDRNAPAGALVFFQGGKYGHIAISTGGANVISTDIGGAGTLTRSTIGTIESKWGQTYVGWTAPFYN